MTATEILQTVIETLKLSELAAMEKSANSATYDDALAQVQELLDDQDAIYSQVVYVPGGCGVVRAVLERTDPNSIVARSIDVTPEGCPKEFVVLSGE